MRITLIGSGNVATHLGAAFKNAGHHVVQVYSRNADHAALLAYHLKAEAISDFNDINPETDLFVISVKDDVIEEVASALSVYQKPMVHTSGATPLAALRKYSDKAGVFYPLQTFSKTKEVNFKTVPVCIEAGDLDLDEMLKQLASTISNSVHAVDSEQRKILHLAAVFACNFPNYLYYASQQLLAQHQLNFDLLRPLIKETADKVQEHMPKQVQTGPAIRNDEQTMASHLALLNGNDELTAIYELLSQAIIKMGKA
jgi:predicted short-subunit dehydrogenase-like oxidoreductase (DUF2520 family)